MLWTSEQRVPLLLDSIAESRVRKSPAGASLLNGALEDLVSWGGVAVFFVCFFRSLAG